MDWKAAAKIIAVSTFLLIMMHAASPVGFRSKPRVIPDQAQSKSLLLSPLNLTAWLSPLM